MTAITLTANMPIMITSELRLRIARGARPVIVKTVPQTMFVDAHERQCDSNHRQTLDRIRQRGGFDAGEAVAVLSHLDYDAIRSVTEESAHSILYSMIALHNGGMRVAERRAALSPQSDEGEERHG